jgi:tetratricopeptide (TPR) repeat protein
VRLVGVPALGALDDLGAEAAARIEQAAADLAADVESPASWLELGAVLHAHGRLALARSAYQQTLLRAPGDARAWYWLAWLEEEHSPERTLLCLAECARNAPDQAPVHWRMGTLQLGWNRLEEADRSFRAALERAPGDAAAVVGLARVRLQEGRPEEAARLLEEHLRRTPQDRHARFQLGRAYRELGRPEDAQRMQAGAVGADPLERDPWREELLARRQGPRADFLRAMELLERGDAAAALPLLEGLRTRTPGDVLVLIGLHRALRMGGDLERALTLLVEARDLDPSSDVVRLHLAGIYRERAHREGAAQGRAWLERALAESERAVELAPTHASAIGLRGDVLLDLGRTEEALVDWTRAAELDRGAPQWQEQAGLALCRAGRWGEAVPFLRRLDSLQPRVPRILLQLAAALANSGELDGALAPLEEARALAPADPSIQKALEDLARARSAARRGGGGG